MMKITVSATDVKMYSSAGVLAHGPVVVAGPDMNLVSGDLTWM